MGLTLKEGHKKIKQVIWKKCSLQKYADKAASSQNFIQGNLLCYGKLIYLLYTVSRICAYRTKELV